MAAAVFHSARDFRAWLERGEGDGEEVFTDAKLRQRLGDPLGTFEAPVVSDAEVLPSEAKALAEKAAPLLGIGASTAEDLLRLWARNRLAPLPVLHYEGAIYELVDLNLSGVLPLLVDLLHSERCEALQALAVVLRGAHDDSHPFAAQCRELSEKLLGDNLEKKLWDLYVKVSGCPRFSSSPEHGEVETVVKQGLELQLCVLECLLLAAYDPQISRRDPEQICRIAEECYRQRFLGSLPRAAHLHHWLLGDAEICSQAQCVGDLCLALLIEHLDLETLEAMPSRHVLVSSPEHVKHLHKLIESWLEICRHTLAPSESTAALAHCGRHVALVVLAWAVLLGCVPESFREAHGLGLKRILSSVVFQSEILHDAVCSIQDRGFLMCDSRNAQHLAARSVARGLVAMVAQAFRLDGPMASIHLAMSKLGAMAFADSSACLEFWRSDYPKRQGIFLVLHGWLMGFPRNLSALLELLCGLSEGHGSLYVAELLKASLNVIQLPYRLLRDVTEFEDCPGSSTGAPSPTLQLLEPAYVEELALRVLGLELLESHVSSCAILPTGARGILQQDRPADPERSPRSSQAHLVQWSLGDQHVSLWRISVCAWDAILSRPPEKRSSEDLELLKHITRCCTAALCPETLEQFLQDLPEEEKGSCFALAARLLASAFILAECALARHEPSGVRLSAAVFAALARLPKLLRPTWRLLEGAPHPLLRCSSQLLVELLAGVADLERQTGSYPATCSALEMIRGLLEACPIELLALPWEAHDALGLPSFSRPGHGVQVTGPSALGPLLDFVFGTCFSRCGFWPCSSLSERWAISMGCLRVAMAIFPALDCFNWPEAASLSAKENSLGHLLCRLRDLQLRVLRCWGEVSFVQNLLQCILCDIAFGPAGSTEGSGRKFVGFRSPALEVEVSTAAPRPGESTRVPTTGMQLVSFALQCLQKLMALMLSPAGLAPHLQSLGQHVLELTSVRESLGPVASIEVLPLRRADLVQSLYAHICCPDSSVATWAAECMTSLCALWCRTEMRHSLDEVRGGRGLLLASLSVPSAEAASGLVKHLATRLIEVLSDVEQPASFRSACGDLLRAALVSQPGLLLDSKDLVTECVKKSAKSLAALVSQVKHSGEESRLFFVSLTLLDDLAGASDLQSFQSRIEGAKGSESFNSLWQLLQKAFEVLRPRLQLEQTCEDFLSLAALLRLAQRGAASPEAPCEELIALLKLLLTAKTLEALNADVEVPLPTASESAGRISPELQREVSFGAFRGAQVFATTGTDFEMLQHPYGSSSEEGVCQRFQQLLSSLELRREVLGPSMSAAGSAAVTLGTASWLSSTAGAAASLAAEAKGRPTVPRCFRSWGELCEMACGEALEQPMAPSEGRPLLRLTLPQERIGCFGSRNGVASSHSGSDIVDGYVLGGLAPLQLETLRLAAAASAAEGLSRNQRGCVDPDDPVLQALRELMSQLPELNREEGCQVACALTFEAFDDLAKSAVRLARKTEKLEGVLAPLLWGLTHHLYFALQQLGQFMEKPRLFSSFLALASHLLAYAPHGAAGRSQAYGPFQAARGEMPRGPMSEMLSHETPAGLALVAQLTAALRSAVSSLRAPVPRAAEMLAAAGLMLAGAEAHEGVLSSSHSALSEVILHTLSLLLQLVPPLGKPPSGAAKGSLQAMPLLSTLLEVLGQLLELLINAEEVRDRQRQRQVARPMESLPMEENKKQKTGAAPGWPARASTAAPGPTDGSVQVLRTPEEAQLREASETQAEELDQILHSGFSSLVFALVERTLFALRRRQGETEPGEQDVTSELLRHVLLPRVLNCSFKVFAGSDPGSSSFGRPFPRGAPSWKSLVSALPRPSPSCGLWDRASEASWACRLESMVCFLLRVAEAPKGVALLMEQRVFVLLAYCPLLRHFVLQTESAYVVPKDNTDTASMVLEKRGLLSAWRKPAQSAWCRVLLLMSTILASGAKVEEAEVVLQVYRSRFCYIFQTALQSGRLAVLEEAALMSRVLAFMSPGSALARSLAEDAAAQAMIFIMGSCLTERSAPSEVFLPSSKEERLAAQVPEVLDGEATPAQVPSIFHQRVEYLGLELMRNLLLALLRISSLPQWLGTAIVTATKVPEGPQGWPTAYQSVFGLKDGGSALNVADPVRLWAMLMDVSLEAGRKAVEYLETLRGQREELHRLMIANSATSTDDPWLPLSLSLVGVGELSTAEGASSTPGFSPSHLAMGLTPMAAPHSPTKTHKSSPQLGPEKWRSSRVRALRYKFAARRPHATMGGQLCSATPEGVTLAELKKLASSVLELSCMLLCRFCQMTLPGSMVAAAPRSPGVGILHGLLSFLHEVLNSDAGLLDAETVAFLAALQAREQHFGEAKVLQQAGHQPNPAFDGDAWVLGEAEG